MPIRKWRHYADPKVAPLRRLRFGSILPIRDSVERLGGIRPAAEKTGLSMNTIQALKQGHATLRSFLILAVAHRSRVRLQKINPRAALWTAKENTWTTPPSLLQQLYPLLPGKTFDIDPCSPCVGPAAPVRAHVHYTEKHDGLRQSWGKSTYCYVNPPFSHLRKWIHKALAEACNGVVSILLCPARVDSIWWHTLVADRIPVVMLRGGYISVVGITASKKRLSPALCSL